jgi:membrane-associated phospholipid phosphatase
LSWFALDKSRRWSLARVLACSYGSGFLADCCKLLIGRTRPNAYDFESGAETFVGFIPFFQTWDVAQLTNRAIQSFPSGHSATAAGLAIVLGVFYPHARWLFALLATLALLQRVEAGAHFPSDTLAGAALGCLVAGVCLDPRLVGRVFDWIERRRW